MIQLISEKLARYRYKSIQCAKTISAGVLVPLFEAEGSTHIVLTKRTDSVNTHKGEVSFPGGTYEEEDGDTRVTALRESYEEIGLRQDDVEIIGRLDDMYTLTGFVLSPHVGIIPASYSFTPSPYEVARIIRLPIDFLINVDPLIEPATHEGRTQNVSSFYYDGDRIWGATCRVLLKFREIIRSEEV